MKQTFKKSVSFLLAFVMLIGVFATLPFTALAANDYIINSTTSTDDYYNLISKKDWDIAPGITESEIVLNNDNGTRRQVLFVMEADLNNEYVKVTHSYTGMVPEYGNYSTGVMSEQAAWAEANGYGNVVGAMNTCLSWYTGYPADRVGEPLGFIMLDAEILFDPANCGYEYGNVGFPSVVVINKDFDENGNPRPADIPKVEMPQIRSAADLDGWEDQVIPCSSGYIVKDGVNVNASKPNHSDAAPRSVVGIKPDGTVVIMLNDGRQSPYSAGMSMYELAEVMLDLGCSFAVNCDGGGSSTYLSQRPGEELKVNNSPSDGGERPTTTGILFISTAASDGVFARANIETEAQYFTPNSQVQFTAKGADVVGGAVEIPDDAVWQLSDSSFGTIDQNGLFISNGTTGTVSAQIVYNDKVVGECEINIVIPDTIMFSQATMTVPNGKSSTFSLSAKYGVFDVVTKDSDFALELGSSEMGTLNGFELMATDDSSVTGGSITAMLVHNTSVTATMQVIYGKASEVIFDFENGFGDSWYVEQVQKRKNWSKTEATSHYNIVVESEAVNAQNGMVHDGNGAGAVYNDNTYATLNWAGAKMAWAGETVTYENVSSIGAWIYFPKDAVSTAVRFILQGTKDGEKVSIDAYPINFGDSLYFEESGWHYCSVDVSEYDSITLVQAPAFKDVNNNNRYTGFNVEFTAQLNGGSSGEYNWVNTPGVKGADAFYIDNLTIDYSEACDDREAPVFGEVTYVEPVTSEDKYLNNQRKETTVTNYNDIGFSVSVSENTERINASGLDASTAKAYIDGNEVECSFSGNNVSVAITTLTNGVHTVKFTICDKAGNYASVIRKINVQGTGADATVKVIPKVDTDMIFTGSQYWVDIVADNTEKIAEVTVTLDLNNVNTWILDHIETLYGFTTTYETDKAHENILYLTIKRAGDVEATGEQILASVPIQTWEWNEEDYPGYYPPAGGDNDLNGNKMYDPYECWQEYVTSNFDVIVNPLAGEVVFTDGSCENFSGEKIQVDTEQKIGTWWSCSVANKVYFADKSSWHLHIAGEATDKAATCTEAGYTGRVFCVGCACVTEEKLGHECDSHNGCGAVLDWGTTVPATGHSFDKNIDGIHTCDDCGNTYYYINGEAQVGWLNINGNDYYMLAGGKVVDGVVEIDGHTYTFENHVLVDGSWEHDGVGLTYWWAGELINGRTYETHWHEINGKKYYFNNIYANTGIARTQISASGSWTYYLFDENGAWLEDYVGVSGDYYFDHGVMVKQYKLVEYNGNYYFINTGFKIAKDTKLYLSETFVEGKTFADGRAIQPGTYQFDAEGKMVIPELKNGVVDDCLYINDVKQLAYQLVEFEGDFYFINDGAHRIAKNTKLYLSEKFVEGKTFADGRAIQPGTYQFDAEGKMVIPELKNGVIDDCLYINDVKQLAYQLVEFEGDFYFINDGAHRIAKNTKLYLSETFVEGKTFADGTPIPTGYYEFDADGKMIVKNGVYGDYIYKNGILLNRYQLVEFDGNFYFINDGNKIAKNLTLYLSERFVEGKTFADGTPIPAGYYKFDAEGKMILK